MVYMVYGMVYSVIGEWHRQREVVVDWGHLPVRLLVLVVVGVVEIAVGLPVSAVVSYHYH